MAIQVCEEIQKKATKCKKGLSCIHNDAKNLCSAKSFINDNLLFVKCLDAKPCPYKNAFGEGHFCACPVRQEIHRKFMI